MSYIISIFSQGLDFLVIKIAHGNALDFMVELSMDAGAGWAYENAEIHHGISRSLINLINERVPFRGNRNTSCFRVGSSTRRS